MASTTSIDSDYYRQHFLLLIDQVYEFYQDLLNEQEIQFYRAVKSLNDSAQCLLTRLCCRKGIFFRQQKLNYEEIPDVANALSDLVRLKLCQLPAELAIADLIPLYTKPEWIHYLQHTCDESPCLNLENGHLKRLSRRQLDTFLETELPSLYSPPDSVIQLDVQQHFSLFQLLYFGNSYQTLSEFIVTQLGHIQYPQYPLNKHSRRFSNRADIDLAFNWHQLQQGFADPKEMTLQQLKTQFQSLLELITTAAQVSETRSKQLLTLVRQIERLCVESSIPLYETMHQQLQNDGAEERIIRYYIKSKQYNRALQRCETANPPTSSESHSLFLHTTKRRLHKKLKIQLPSTDDSIVSIPTETMELIRSDLSVEQAAAQALSQFGDAYFVENSIFTALFSVIFWREIYSDTLGAFSHPFQSRPHDLYERNFLIRRNTTVEAIMSNLPDRLENICNKAQFEDINQRHSALGPWPALDYNLLSRAYLTIPNNHLTSIFLRMWKDLRYCRSGFPDLIYFDKKGHYKLIEIKGPGDTLQPNQVLWLEFFQRQQIPASVIHIRWQ